MISRNIFIAIEESAGLGTVVSGLEVVKPSLANIIASPMGLFYCFSAPLVKPFRPLN